MNTRIAVITIMVENPDAVEAMNNLLHSVSDYVIGRMGVPYRPKHLSVISVVLDAPQDVTSALSGKLGQLAGVTTKTIYAKQEPCV